jgi:hypothetical protein
MSITFASDFVSPIVLRPGDRASNRAGKLLPKVSATLWAEGLLHKITNSHRIRYVCQVVGALCLEGRLLVVVVVVVVVVVIVVSVGF